MEEAVSPELSLAPEPEQSHEPLDNCSQAVTEGDKEQQEQVDDASDEKLEDSETSAKATSEVKKTWGFRRTTIAKREMPGDVALESHEGPGAVRRSGRQAKRTDKLEEFLSTKRGGRRSAPAGLEGGDPPSQTPTDAETASEASFDGNADAKSVDDKSESPERRTRSGIRKKLPATAKSGGRRSQRRRSIKDEGSSENEHEEDGGGDEPRKSQSRDEEDGEKEGTETKPSPAEKATNDAEITNSEQDAVKEMTTVTGKEEEEGKTDKVENAEEKKTEAETEDGDHEGDGKEKPAGTVAKRTPLRTYTNKRRAANKNAPPAKNPTPVKKDAKAKVAQAAAKSTNVLEDEESTTSSSSSSSSSSSDSEGAGYDPNALYCICRQKHNKRFMICCDRCEEWFHGDCVGITEARGRLMERNGEDYICPNCTAKKSQVVKPATTAPAGNAENGKTKGLAAAALNIGAGAASRAEPTASATAPSSSGPGGPEEKAEGDHGIKGRIEKATNPSGKKKIKIFQPALVKTADQRVAQKAGPNADDSSLPKCIGPGCGRNAQPDSVYCGNDCILRHAAAAMKSITDVKEPKAKDKAQKTPGPRSAPKRSNPGRRKPFKKSAAKDKSYSEEEEDEDEDEDEDDEDDDEDEHAEEHPPPPAASSWSSDHNYNAVTPEKTTPISPTVLNKTCMYLLKVLIIYS